MEDYGRAKVVYKDPHYSNPADVPRRDREYGGKRFRLRGTTMRFLPEFKHYSPDCAPRTSNLSRQPSLAGRIQTWEFSTAPPSAELAAQWLKDHGTPRRYIDDDGETLTVASTDAKTSVQKPRFDPIKSQVRSARG